MTPQTAEVKTAQPASPSLPRMPQLDALRGLAVLAVVAHHFGPGGWELGAYLDVKLFFCLSGFLITGILLRARDIIEANHYPRLGGLLRFYVHRFLRIFPLYYFVVAVCWLINLPPARDVIGWLLTYTMNIHMARQGWYDDNFGHFWTLSVEEQFYLFWPLLILFIPRRWIKPAIIGVLLVGPLYRISYVLSGYISATGLATYIATPVCLDHLGAGALLATLTYDCPRALSRWTWRGPLIMVLSLIASAVLMHLGPLWFQLLHDPVQALGFTLLVYYVSNQVGGPVGRLLQWQPLLYIGKISYGIYVYHPFMPKLTIFLAGLSGSHPLKRSIGVSLMAAALTLIVSSLSWHLLERPLNRLKRYF